MDAIVSREVSRRGRTWRENPSGVTEWHCSDISAVLGGVSRSAQSIKKWQGIIVLETDAGCRNTLALLVIMVDFAVLGCDDIWGCATHAVNVMYTRLADRRYV